MYNPTTHNILRDTKRFPVQAAVTLCLFLSFLLTGAGHAGAQDDKSFSVDFGGYLKELGQFSFDNFGSELHYDNIIHHRLETDWTFSGHFEVQADIRTRVLNGYTVNNTANLVDVFENDPNYVDLAWVWNEGDRTIIHSNIDRLYGSYLNGPLEIHAGRQRINWGKTLVWNPNDLFNNYAFLDFDYEERQGVDALLAQYHWSYASSAEIGFRMADSYDEMVWAAMLRTNIGSYDVQVIGGHYFEDAAFGLGWSGYIKNAGFKGELTYFHPEDRFFEETGHFTATLGGDFLFPNSIYLQGELLYNGGFDRNRNPINELVTPPDAGDLFIAETGFFANISYPYSPLVSSSLGFLASFDRSVFIFIPQISYSVTENVDVLLLSQLLKGTVFDITGIDENLLFIRIKWSY